MSLSRPSGIQDLTPRGYISSPRSERVTHRAIVGQLDRGSVEALDYARSIAAAVG